MDLLGIAPATEEDLELADTHDKELVHQIPPQPHADAKTQREAAEKYKLGEVWDKHYRCLTNGNPVIENLGLLPVLYTPMC
jgi:hypothetical protein